MAFTLITGASGVLGGEFVKIYALRGENLLLTGQSEERLALVKEKYSNVAQIKTFACSLSEQSERERLFAFIEGEGVSVSRIIHCAGNDNQYAFEKYSQQSLLGQARVNYEAPLSLTLYCLQRFPVQEILVISSLTAVTPTPYFAVYTSSKRALWDFFTAIKRENEIKITVALPGSIPTRKDVIADIKKQGLTGKLSSKSPEKVAKKCVKALEKNKDKVVIGFYNKVLYFLSKMTPLKLQQKIMAKKFKNKSKENFK